MNESRRGLPHKGSARAIDRAVVRLTRGRGAIDLALSEALGRLFLGDRLLQLGYSQQKDYARERLGVPVRTVYSWTALARAVSSRPVLREAVMAGAVSSRKTILVSPVAVGVAEARWVAVAMALTHEDLRRRMRAAGAEPGDEDVFEIEQVVFDMTPQHDQKRRRQTGARSMSPARRQVWERHGGFCAVPGCSCAAAHEHHIVYRARGGSDDLKNRLGLCSAHHLRGVHRGYLTVTGEAGKTLCWQLGTGVGATVRSPAADAAAGEDEGAQESWITTGNDDVQRTEAPIRRRSA